jgi:hypothetical protein
MYCPNADCPYAQRSGKPAEYVAGSTRCSDCGSVLVEANPAQSTGESPAQIDFAPLIAVHDAALASVVQSVLATAGIRFVIKGEVIQDLFGVGRLGVGFNPVTGPAVLSVESSRLDEARELLRQSDEEIDSAGEDGAIAVSARSQLNPALGRHTW